MAHTVIFVYGTLKTGQSGNGKMAGQQFLGTATTMPLYRLYGLGWHPGLVRDTEHGLAIEGELWGVDDRALALLDEYEGVPDWYGREPIALQHHTGDCLAYFYKHEIPAGAPTGSVWPFPA
ncbi:gamma-glutamylcyclotransferase family protein [Zavarzinella formosa]|uniref:gamma-glutamylcyclotransferase family protein n=1 Tax=Zavarzinella formosa TaxID=360055 RepID=UPI0003784D58|nr:gamma-glutamylcyclotransferase family protein [Zavarzinella formosa]